MTLPLGPEPPPIRITGDGVAMVGDTRVPLDTVVYFHQHGAPPEAIVDRFPTLDLADVYAAVAYYIRHEEVVERYLRAREREADEVRRELQGRTPPGNLREGPVAQRALR